MPTTLEGFCKINPDIVIEFQNNIKDFLNQGETQENALKKGYRKMLKKYHPDDPRGDVENAKLANNMYDLLENGKWSLNYFINFDVQSIKAEKERKEKEEKAKKQRLNNRINTIAMNIKNNSNYVVDCESLLSQLQGMSNQLDNDFDEVKINKEIDDFINSHKHSFKAKYGIEFDFEKDTDFEAKLKSEQQRKINENRKQAKKIADRLDKQYQKLTEEYSKIAINLTEQSFNEYKNKIKQARNLFNHDFKIIYKNEEFYNQIVEEAKKQLVMLDKFVENLEQIITEKQKQNQQQNSKQNEQLKIFRDLDFLANKFDTIVIQYEQDIKNGNINKINIPNLEVILKKYEERYQNLDFSLKSNLGWKQYFDDIEFNKKAMDNTLKSLKNRMNGKHQQQTNQRTNNNQDTKEELMKLLNLAIGNMRVNSSMLILEYDEQQVKIINDSLEKTRNEFNLGLLTESDTLNMLKSLRSNIISLCHYDPLDKTPYSEQKRKYEEQKKQQEDEQIKKAEKEAQEINKIETEATNLQNKLSDSRALLIYNGDGRSNKDKEESIDKLTVELSAIIEDCQDSNRTVTSEQLKARLNFVRKTLREEFSLNLEDEKTMKKKHRVTSVKRAGYGLTGTALGIAGLAKVVKVTQIIHMFGGFSLLALPSTLAVVPLLIATLILIKKAARPNEKLLITKIIKKLVDQKERQIEEEEIDEDLDEEETHTRRGGRR